MKSCACSGSTNDSRDAPGRNATHARPSNLERAAHLPPGARGSSTEGMGCRHEDQFIFGWH